MASRPPFEALPLRKDGPRGNAWGLWGENDELGHLNLLTPDVVTSAAKEIQDGTRVSVNLPLGHLKTPCFNRVPLVHKLISKAPAIAFDDSLDMNTQSSSQWDGFRHFAYQKEKLFYNGKTPEDILNDPEVIGTQAWENAGGIVGRGVLLDYALWADQQGLSPAAFAQTTISPEELNKIAAAQNNTTILPGDIIFVRTGYGRSYSELSDAERQALADNPKPPAIGLDSSEPILRWLWEKSPSAIAGDTTSVEAWPPVNLEYCLHEWVLAGWGMPLGELLDLETLSEVCQEKKRWSFFFTSMPLKVIGGVASPPNGIAIF